MKQKKFNGICLLSALIATGVGLMMWSFAPVSFCIGISLLLWVALCFLAVGLLA